MVLALSTLCAPSSLEWAELKQVVPSRWQGTSPDMTTLYLQAMDAMHKACNRCSLTALPCLPNSSCTVFDSLNSLCVISGYWPSQASLQLPFAAASESLNAGAAASSGGGGRAMPPALSTAQARLSVEVLLHPSASSPHCGPDR